MAKKEGFPVRKMHIQLAKANPSKLTVEELKKQLNGMGLMCSHTSIEALTLYKSEVMRTLPSSQLQACEIAKPSNGFSEAAFLNGRLGDSDEPYIDGAMQLEDAATGEWMWDVSGAGYQKELETIQIPAHFDYLMKCRPGFSGQKKTVETKKQLTSVDAIKGLFIETAEAASTTLGKPINKDSIEAFYSNVISPLNESDVSKDYSSSDSRVLILTLNCVDGESCDGVGVINVSWDISIKNYKRKTKKGGDYHDTSISILCRGMFYSDPDVLISDYEIVKNAFKNAQCLMNYPKRPVPVPVFQELPKACQDTFIKGIPSEITENYVDSIILHTPRKAKMEAVTKIDHTGFTLKSCQLPNADISYVIQDAPSDDENSYAQEENGAAGLLLNAAPLQENDAIVFDSPVNLTQTVYKADILRHNISDGSYQFVESGEFYSGHFVVAE